MSIFEQASREKIRFAMAKGLISTEDLWELKLEDLDNIARGLSKMIRESSQDESFIRKTTASSKNFKILELKFDVVKHIIDVKLEERDKKALAAERAAKRAQLLELIGKKEVTALEGKSIEELKRELAELD